MRSLLATHREEVEEEVRRVERDLWHGGVVLFQEGPLGMSVSDKGGLLKVSAFRDEEGGGAGQAERSGKVVVGEWQRVWVVEVGVRVPRQRTHTPTPHTRPQARFCTA